MSEESIKHSEELALDELDSVSGGSKILYPKDNKIEQRLITCPKCGSDKCRSGNLPTAEKMFMDYSEYRYFITSGLQCCKCGYQGLASSFTFTKI